MSAEDELKELEEMIVSLKLAANDTLVAEGELLKEADEIRRAFEVAIKEVNLRLDQIRNESFHRRRKIREAEQRRQQLIKLAEEEKRNETLLKNIFALQQELEDIMGNYPWSDRIKKHQKSGASWIALKKRLILADVMGLGKTLTAISALDLIKEITKDAKPNDVFITDPLDRFPVSGPAGKRVLYLSSAELSWGVWQEFKKWAPHRNVVILTGQSKQARRVVLDALKQMSDEFVVIFNYEGWRKDLNILQYLQELKFDTIICDESHKLKEGEKNIGYRGTAAIMSGTPSPYRILLTGTPVLNKPQELFPQLALIDPYMFYNEKQFLQEYCEQKRDQNGQLRWVFRPGGIEILYRKIGDVILRRTKKDAGIDLPEKTIINHNLQIDEELYPHQARARREMRKWGSIMLDPENYDKGYISAAAQIAVLTRLRQIEVWPAGITIRDPKDKNIIRVELDVHESQKIDYIISNPMYDDEGNMLPPMGLITEALSGGERVAVFSQFVEPLRELHRRLAAYGYRPALFVGDASREHKEEVKRDFDASLTKDEDAKYDVILANYKIGGEGVNFTGASQMIILDEEWNPGKRDQAYDRLHRIGQQKPVTIHVIRVEKTVDSWLAGLIQFKEETVGAVESTFNQNEAFKALTKGEI